MALLAAGGHVAESVTALPALGAGVAGKQLPLEPAAQSHVDTIVNKGGSYGIQVIDPSASMALTNTTILNQDLHHREALQKFYVN